MGSCIGSCSEPSPYLLILFKLPMSEPRGFQNSLRYLRTIIRPPRSSSRISSSCLYPRPLTRLLETLILPFFFAPFTRFLEIPFLALLPPSSSVFSFPWPRSSLALSARFPTSTFRAQNRLCSGFALYAGRSTVSPWAVGKISTSRERMRKMTKRCMRAASRFSRLFSRFIFLFFFSISMLDSSSSPFLPKKGFALYAGRSMVLLLTVGAASSSGRRTRRVLNWKVFIEMI